MTSRQSDKGHQLLSILIGGLCLVACFIMLYFKRHFQGDISLYLRILFALGIAGLSAALIGSIKIEKFHGISAVGGFAVFVLLYFCNPVGFHADNFDLTLLLKNKGNQGLPNINGTISLMVGNNKRTVKISEDATVEFKQIPASFKGSAISAELQMPGWQFASGRTDTQVTLEQDSAIIIIQRDSSLCCITGTVKDEQGNYLQGVVIMVNGVVDSSNQYGYFELKLPPAKQLEEQQVVAIKKGYRSFSGSVYPSTQAPLNIALRRK